MSKKEELIIYRPTYSQEHVDLSKKYLGALKNKIKDQRNFLFNAVRSNGFYFAKIETKLINNQNNSVDIIYNFILGERAIIKKITFTGNKIFKDSKLRNII